MNGVFRQIDLMPRPPRVLQYIVLMTKINGTFIFALKQKLLSILICWRPIRISTIIIFLFPKTTFPVSELDSVAKHVLMTSGFVTSLQNWSASATLWIEKTTLSDLERPDSLGVV